MIDTHCHLELCEPGWREQPIDRIATIGMEAESIARALAFADEREEVFAIVGRHPHSAAGFAPEEVGEIRAAAAHPKVVAIGEVGLDHYRDYAPRADQLLAFEAQIELAHELGKPLVIHCRAAEDDTLALLAERASGLTVVLHCFSMPDRLEECVERGYLCSFAGNVTYRKATELQQAAARVPEELLLLETDAPFLSPEPLRGKPNLPANVRHTAERVAELRGVSAAELWACVERNAARVFGW